MNIMNKKFLRTLLLMLLPAFFVGQAFGQKVEPNGFVGDDLYKLLYEGEGDDDAMTVTIGKKGNTSECVYEWEMESRPDGARLPNIVSPTQPQTAVVFYDVGSYMFKLTRVSIYGYQQEYVTVMLYGGIKLLSAKPEHPEKCWAAGDVVHDWDFDFETEPPGYQARVHVAEEDAEIDGFLDDLPVHDHEIRFVIDNQQGFERVKSMVSVLNKHDEFSINVVVGTANTPTKIKQQWQDLKGALNKIVDAQALNQKLNRPAVNGFFNKMKAFAKKSNLHLQPIFDISINPSLGLKCDCCNGDALTYVNIGGTFRWALGISMDAPIPGYYIPGIGGLAIMGFAQFEGNLFPVPNVSIPITSEGFTNCFQTSVPIGTAFSGELVGGVEIVSRDVASAVIGFELRAESTWSIHTSSPYIKDEGGGLKVYGKIEARLASFSLAVSKYLLYPTVKKLEEVIEEPKP